MAKKEARLDGPAEVGWSMSRGTWKARPLRRSAELPGTIEEVAVELTAALHEKGFGILSRLDIGGRGSRDPGAPSWKGVIIYSFYPRGAGLALISGEPLIHCSWVIRDEAPRGCAIDIAARPVSSARAGDERVCHLGREAEGLFKRLLLELERAFLSRRASTARADPRREA